MISYRDYFKSYLDVDSYIMHHKQSAPDDFPYITIDFVNANEIESTKLRDLGHQDVFITFGVHEDTLHEMNDLYVKVKEVLLYKNIPLLNSEGNQAGEFKIEEITNEVPIRGGDYERLSQHHRIYIDTRIGITHIKH